MITTDGRHDHNGPARRRGRSDHARCRLSDRPSERSAPVRHAGAAAGAPDRPCRSVGPFVRQRVAAVDLGRRPARGSPAGAPGTLPNLAAVETSGVGPVFRPVASQGGGSTLALMRTMRLYDCEDCGTRCARYRHVNDPRICIECGIRRQTDDVRAMYLLARRPDIRRMLSETTQDDHVPNTESG